MHKPSWFRSDEVLVVNAATCGINKDGHEQYVVNPDTGARSSSKIDDKLWDYVSKLPTNDFSDRNMVYRDRADIEGSRTYVPKYFDVESIKAFEADIAGHDGLSSRSLRELFDDGLIVVRGGHGSPGTDQRVGDVPYIKVSDLRAGSVNINPTNMVPMALAQDFWRGAESGLQAYDLISPERASKNIGEFCVLMPGQEKVLLTKEVIIIRARDDAPFDQFYLMWALSLYCVRMQWERIIFMQTNREDVGKRVWEIRIPYPKDRVVADAWATPFREYFTDLERLKTRFQKAINASPLKHHMF